MHFNREEELDGLFGGYLHQDYPEDYGTWDVAVLEYALHAEKERVRFVRSIIQELRDSSNPYEATEAMFKEIRHSGYHPWVDYPPGQACEWLQQVLELLDKGLQEHMGSID